jgi:hypothetical protein
VLTPKVARQNSGLRLRLPLPLVNSSDSGDNSDRSPTSVKEVKDKILASSKSILGKVLSPTKEKFARDKVGTLCYMSYTYYTKCERRLTSTGHAFHSCDDTSKLDYSPCALRRDSLGPVNQILSRLVNYIAQQIFTFFFSNMYEISWF